MRNMVYLVTSNTGYSCNYVKIRCAVIGYLFSIFTSNTYLKFIDKSKSKNKNKKINGLVIDLDGSYKEVAKNVQKVFDKVPSPIIDIYSSRKLFDLMFGAALRSTVSTYYALAYSTLIHINLFSPEEILKKLNKTNVHKTRIGYFMRLIFRYKLYGAKYTTITNEILNDGGDNLCYFKAIANKYKIKFNPISYISNITNIEMLMHIAADPTICEYSRNIVVHFQNIITLGKLYKNINISHAINYLLAINILADKFIYAIYLNKYDGKEYVLVNYICNSKSKYKKQIEKIEKIARKRYPDGKITISGTIIKEKI